VIHKFKSLFNDGFIVLDVNSGSVHLADKTVSDILDGAETDDKEALAEIEELRGRGLLFSDEPQAGTPSAAKPVIKALCLLVAQGCNLSCAYCFAGGDYGESGMMSPETGKKAVDFLREGSKGRRNLEIDFFGGEPLLNMETVKAVVEYAKSLEAAHNKRFRFTLTTNGLLLDDAVTAYLNDSMQNVVLSLDGREAVNDRARGAGVYKRITPKIKAFAKARAAHPVNSTMYVRGTFTRWNLDFCADALHLAELGFRDVSVEPVVAPESAEYALREADLPVIFEEYERLAKALYDRRGTERGFNFFHFNIDLESGPCYYKRISGCGAGSQYAAVTADGRLYPCHQFASLPDRDRFLMGDVWSGITDASGGRASGATLEAKPDCKDCFAKYHCGGGCAANAYAFSGDVLGTYRLSCEMERKRVELALMLKNEEDIS
jgi:uncharacterized protein